jgi:hypothetical protein
MSRFIKSFVGSSTVEVADKANSFAKDNKLEIVTANMAFSGSGRVFEQPVLVVVFEDEKPKRARRKHDKEDDSDE